MRRRRLKRVEVKIKQVSQVPANQVEVAGASGTKIQWLLGSQDEPENFYMRLFELEPGGHTPRHDHPWEHEVFVLSGKGSVLTVEGQLPLARHSVVYVPSKVEHQFRNDGDEMLRFLCLVPKSATY